MGRLIYGLEIREEEMKDILQAVEEKRREVEKLRVAVQGLAIAEQDLAAMERTLKILRGEGDKNPQGPPIPFPPSPTSVSIARMILADTGKPLHVDDLVREFEARGFPMTKGTLVSSISRNIKSNNPLFVKKGKNTFGLKNEITPQGA